MSRRCTSLLSGLLLLLLVTGLPGCGGGMSQRSMMDYALPNDDEEEETQQTAPAAAPATPAPTAVAATSPKPATAAGTQSPSNPTGAPSEAPADTRRWAEPLAHERPTDRELTEIERRQWAIDNLRKIAEAMELYRQEHQSLPGVITDASGSPLLSWRVRLLPYLGHPDLYESFKIDQPWDSAHNLELLKQIPAVFQSPEHADDRTNFQVPLDSFALFTPNGQQTTLNIEDGFANVLMLLEVDDPLAVPWTQPTDYRVTRDLKGLAHQRNDGLFCVFGGGLLRRIPVTTKPEDILKLIQVDDLSGATPSRLSFAVYADPARESAMASQDALPELQGLSATAQGSEAPGEPGASEGITQVDPGRQRLEPPAESQLTASRQLFREIYAAQFAETRTRDQRKRFAEDLLSKAQTLSEDPTGKYVLLQAARNIANDAQCFDTGKQAVEALVRDYSVDEYPLHVELLRAVSTVDPSDELVDHARVVAEIAIDRDDFETAGELVRIATGAHNKLNEPQGRPGRPDIRGVTDDHVKEELAALGRRVILGRAEYGKLQSVLARLAPDDPTANSLAGRYYCLVKQNWSEGLALLVRGSDPEFRRLADLELTRPSSGEEKIELADGWWTLGDQLKLHRRELWRHALVWYLRAADQLPDGLLRIKAETRIQEAERELGAEIVAEVRQSLIGPQRQQVVEG